MKDWFYDEHTHVGVDYATEEAAGVYDEQMDFRDYAKEARTLIRMLDADTSEMTAIDIGCGTGAFAIHAAGHFKRVMAVDVSEKMLGIARAKAEADAIGNISFHHAGFLRFRAEEPADVINTKWAFHHLPDFWKQAALLNMNTLLKPGGALFLTDLIFRFSPEYEEDVQAMLDGLGKDHDEAFVEEVKLHIREEFSTFDWILTGMIERAGFKIERVLPGDDLATGYLCRKPRSSGETVFTTAAE